MNANWHCACVIAWQFWNAPSDYARLLRRLQARRCGQSGGRLWKSAEVDHRVPLFRVWSEHRETPWPDLLTYWGLPNLQVSIVTLMPQNVPSRRETDVPHPSPLPPKHQLISRLCETSFSSSHVR